MDTVVKKRQKEKVYIIWMRLLDMTVYAQYRVDERSPSDKRQHLLRYLSRGGDPHNLSTRLAKYFEPADGSGFFSYKEQSRPSFSRPSFRTSGSKAPQVEGLRGRHDPDLVAPEMGLLLRSKSEFEANEAEVASLVRGIWIAGFRINSEDQAKVMTRIKRVFEQFPDHDIILVKSIELSFVIEDMAGSVLRLIVLGNGRAVLRNLVFLSSGSVCTLTSQGHSYEK